MEPSRQCHRYYPINNQPSFLHDDTSLQEKAAGSEVERNEGGEGGGTR